MSLDRARYGFLAPAPVLFRGQSLHLSSQSGPSGASRRGFRVMTRMTAASPDAVDDFGVAGLVVQRVDTEIGQGPAVMFGQLSSTTRKALIAAFVAGAAIGGYKTVPENKFDSSYVPVAASIASAGVAAIGSVALVKEGKKGSKKAAAAALAHFGPTNAELRDALEAVKAEYDIEESIWRIEMRDLYAMYLMEMVSSTEGTVLYKEVNHLILLKRALGLSGPEVGDGHFEVARAFYRENVIYLGDPEGGVEAEVTQKKLDKLLFLSDRMFSDKEPEEAYMYETARLRKHFGLEPADYNTRVAAIAEPFYEDIIVHAINEGGVKESNLRSAQKLLGLSDATCRRLERDQYSAYVLELVDQKSEITNVDLLELNRLQTLLSVAADDAKNILERVSEPEFRAVAEKAVAAVIEEPSAAGDVYATLSAEQQKLQVPADLARAVLGSEVKKRFEPYTASSIKFLRVSNVTACAKEVAKLLQLTDSMLKLLTLSDPSKSAADLLKLYVPTDTGAQTREATQLYSVYLQELVKREGKVSAGEKENLARLQIILGLSPLAADEAYRKATGPMYKRQLVAVFAANRFDDEARAKLDGLQADLTLPEDTAQKMKLESYSERLRSYVKDNRILTVEEGNILAKIREFLNLDDTDVIEIHKVQCRDVYEQSVSEAMGTTGIIMENYREALDKLRERLYLSRDTADQIFYAVAKGRMRAYATRAVESMEKKRQARGQGEKRDVGDDPFIKRAGAQLGIDASGLNVELHNLVDFYMRNKLMKVKEVEVEEGDGKVMKQVAEFPVTLRDALSQQTITELYKQYLIQCFSAKSREEKERLFGVLDQLASILGLEQGEVDTIHSDIGSVIYKNYIGQQLIQGPLGEKDRQFLTNIQNTLAMTPAMCETIEAEAKKNRVMVLMEQMINRQRILPENAKKVRTTAQEFGVSLVDDLKVPNVDRMRAFNVEVDAGIESGNITSSNQQLLREAKEGWQISDDDARKVLLDNIERRCSTLLVQAASSVRQGNQETAVNEIRTMLRFGRLLPAEVTSPVVSDAEKQELLLLYQAFLITDSAMSEEVKKDISLLTTMLGISDEVLQGA